jgi:hypothetical protein
MVRDRPFAEDLETLNQFGFLIDYELLCASEPVRDHAMYVVVSFSRPPPTSALCLHFMERLRRSSWRSNSS